MTWTLSATGHHKVGQAGSEIKEEAQAAIDLFSTPVSASLSGTDGNGDSFSYTLTSTPEAEVNEPDANEAIDISEEG
jgi:hypothetical protein